MGNIFSAFFLWPLGGAASECNITEQACPVGDVNFRWIGRVDFDDLAYLSVDKFG